MSRWIGVFLVTGLLLSGCVPPEEDDDVIPQFNEETIMYEIQQRGTLRIGLPSTAPPFGFGGEDDTDPMAGFSAEFAWLIAEAMGVEPDFSSAPGDAQLLGLVQSGEVEIAFPVVPITESGVRLFRFTDPYFIGHQRLMVPPGSDIDSIDDLEGLTVCSLIDEDTGVELDMVNPNIEVRATADPADCVPLLEDGTVAAITAPDTTLLRLAVDNPELVITGEQITTAGYGGVLGPGTSGFVNFINTVFTEADEEGDWTKFYEKWIALHTDERVPDPPDMTWEEAAALFPAEP